VSPDDERRACVEARQAMAEALRTAARQGGEEMRLRDQFLRNMPLPRSAEALVDEMFHCQRFFAEDLGAETSGPQARYQACLNRLELLATEDPELAQQLAVLSRQLERHRRRLARNNWILTVVVGGLLVGGVALGLWILRGIAALWRG
jgi:hypothetical protein